MDVPIQAPLCGAMPPALREAAREVAKRLATAGHRAWLVGGAVRDLALGRALHDADLATAATPDEIEACFARTIAVGRAFGTVVVCVGDENIEVTTFRTEGGYSDGRRPDEVAFGETPTEDAERRDFTCNAMFLDPLTDELFDPMGGLADLRAGRLRCVGDAHRRFDEDGLRLMRLARFAASLGMEPSVETLAGASANASRIGSVSGERILQEWTRIADGPAPVRAVEVLLRTGVLAVLLDGAIEHVPERIESLGAAPGIVRLLATMLAPGVRGQQTLAAWHPSRQVARGVERARELEADLARLIADGETARRCERIRVARDASFGDALAVFRARGAAAVDQSVDFAAFAEGLSDAEMRPSVLLSAEDFRAAGVQPGPAWGQWLRLAEDLRLDGEHDSRAQALRWLALKMAETRAAEES